MATAANGEFGRSPHGVWAKFVRELHVNDLGQGAILQLYLADLGPVLAALVARSWPLYQPHREIWRRTGDVESSQREFFVRDPDGYLVMVARNIGVRPAA